MKSEWLEFATGLALSKPDFYDGSKKIFRNQQVTFRNLDEPFEVQEIGYQQTKMSLLTKLYVHEESLQAAVKQWDHRVKRMKYGSVGFHCYNHILKPHSGETANKRSSKLGPCLQSVILTCNKDRVCEVNTYYRSTEIFKKFPADLLLLRDILLPRFSFDRVPLDSITFGFANVTVSPIYLSSVLPFYDDPVELLEELEEKDPRFHRASAKWLSRFLDPDAEPYKFKQARRVGEALKRLMLDRHRHDVLEHCMIAVNGDTEEPEEEDDED